jgi:hypothetical protein
VDFWPSELRGRGSVARDSTVASDIDVLVDLNPDRGKPLLMVAGIAEELRQLPGVRIDLVTSPGRATYAEVEESESPWNASRNGRPASRQWQLQGAPIDTAAAYFNEKQVGEGLANSRVDRAEVFVETKIWITDYGYDETLHSFDKSAGKLGVDQIDLLLLHQPLFSKFDQTLGSYRALEKLLTDSKVRAIGVSNFTVEHLTRLLDSVDVVSAVNQIQLHPYFQQRDV